MPLSEKFIERLERDAYKIQINYKSGIQMQFWVYELTTNSKFSKCDYQHCFRNTNALGMGLDNVESIWQVDFKPAGNRLHYQD